MASTEFNKRRICIVTGSRADYGLLKTLMHEIRNDAKLELQILATGMHLASEFGRTIDRIKEDGFEINEPVESLLSGDSYASVAKSVGMGIIGFADALSRLKPDLVVVLGDRFEIFAAASAAMFLRLPLAHIHGGEVTEGAMDESIRHAITKMSHVHFTSTEIYRQRVIQMGEDGERVFNVGAPGLDLATMTHRVSRTELMDALQFQFQDHNILVTYHPETLDIRDAETSVAEVLRALETFPEYGLLITMPNADASGRAVAKALQEFAAKHRHRAKLLPNLGELYFSAIQEVDFVLGNSSSGIIEVPFFKKPTVNIGDRQKGRLRADSVIDCLCETSAIIAAMQKAASINKTPPAGIFVSPYGSAGASRKIKDILGSLDLARIQRKPFQDLTVSK
jgi:UDP-hydrolysing UDP-N-acetyl-D-glucosamine 2-epimerase